MDCQPGFAVNRIVPGADPDLSAVNNKISFLRITVIICFQAVLPAGNLNLSAFHQHRILSFDSIFCSRYLDLAGNNLYIILPPDAVAVISIYLQTSCSVYA